MKHIIMMLLLSFSAVLIHAQEYRVKGQVKDANGETIIGASVRETGTTNGTITDLNGEFYLTVRKGVTIEISYIGYESQTMVVNNAHPLEIILNQESLLLDQVVIVGTTMNKKDLTGAISHVTTKDIENIPATSINQAIQGKMTGVQVRMSDPRPGGSTSIQVRGNNSIQYGTSPIYVVDGVVMEGGFDLINPNDVASIDVLKDASATAIYGSRGANGVVLITTKKGKGQKSQIEYNGWVGIQEFANKMDLVGTKDLYQLREDAVFNHLKANNPALSDAEIQNQIHASGNPYFGEYEDKAYRDNQTYNWLDEVTRTGFQQNHNISFANSSDGNSTYISFGYTNQKGLIDVSQYKRYSGKINTEQRLKKWLKIGTATSFNRSEDDRVEGQLFSNALYANPMLPISKEPMVLKWGNVDDLDAANPLRSLDVKWTVNTDRVFSNNYIDINPIPGLTFRSSFGIDIMNTRSAYYRPKSTYEGTRNDQNGEANQNKERWCNWQWDNTITYNKLIAEKHNLSVMMGTSATRNLYEASAATTYNFPVDDFGYDNMGAGAGEKFTTSTASEYSLISYLARFNYNYNQKYDLTLTARYDGSSKFRKGNRFALFPSIAGAWTLSEEEFIKKLHFFDLLKLRVGYGIAGNQNIPDYSYLNQYTPDGSTGNLTFIRSSVLGNPDLKWEKQKQFNVGLDFSLLKNRLNISVDYFHILNEDLLMSKPLATSSGFTSTIANVGRLKNEGVEISISSQIINNRDFQWNLQATLSHDKNTVDALYGNVDAIYNIYYNGIQRTGNLFVGESLNTVYSYKFHKICQQEDMDYVNGIDYGGKIVQPGDMIPVDVNDDKIINDEDRIVVGKLDPKIYGGFSTEFSWKDITLSGVFNYSVGAKRISNLYETMMNGTGSNIAHKDILDRWTPDHTNTDIPRAFYASGRYNYNDVDWGIQDASFLRLSTLSLSYNFPQKLVRKMSIDKLRVYFTGSNLFCLTNYKGFDPEGGDSYPTARMYVFGLNFSF